MLYVCDYNDMVWYRDRALLMFTRDFTCCWSPWWSPRSMDTSRKTASSSCTDAQSCQVSLKYASPHGASPCCLLRRSHLTCGLGDFPSRLFVHPWPCATDCTSLFLLFRFRKKKIKERKKKKGSGAQRMHKTVATFVFWKKKPQGFCILLCTGLSWKQTKVKSVIFPEKAEGLLYFPAHPRMNHHSQAAVGDNAAQFSAQIYI